MKTRVLLLFVILAVFAGCESDSNLDSSSYPASPIGPSQTLDVPEEYATIQAAVDAAETGDFIRVAAGVYSGDVLIQEKSFSLRGTGMGQTIIQGFVQIYDTSETSFEGFTVKGGGIHVRNSPVRMSGNEIIENPGIGLWVEDSSRVVLSGNVIQHNGKEGIVFNNSQGVIGSSRVLYNGTDGIVVNNASPTLLNNTVVMNQRDGISIRGFTTYAAPLLLENVAYDNGGTGNFDVICFGQNTNPTGAGNVFDSCINCEECRSFENPPTYQD